MQVDDLDLIEIKTLDDVPPVVVHGTYHRAWQSIKHQGLSRMKRNHIHFAPGLPGQDGVISGMRGSCQVLIYINMKKALEDGLKFFRSSNNVILSPGDVDGYIKPLYFDKVCDVKSGKLL
jgi:2'-phosphotransferase